MIIDNKLAEVFDLAPAQEGEVIKPDGTVLPPDENMENYDFNKARDNMHTLLQYGQEGLDFALQIAKDSENPRALEVFAGLLKNLADTNVALTDMHEKRKRPKKDTSKPADTQGVVSNVQNNNVFVGTTKDLKKFINDLKNGNTE